MCFTIGPASVQLLLASFPGIKRVSYPMIHRLSPDAFLAGFPASTHSSDSTPEVHSICD